PPGYLVDVVPVDEGSPPKVYSLSLHDALPISTAGFHYAFDCAGGSLAGATYLGAGTSASTSCTFPDGPATKTVRARIIDKDGGYGENTTALNSRNFHTTLTAPADKS